MTWRLQIRQAIGEIPYRWGDGRPRANTLSVLLYHAVTDEDLRDPEQQSVSARAFAAQMEAVQNSRVRWVSLEEGLLLLKKGGEERPMATVVFDDGYVGVHDFAREVLIRHRIPATLFLATEQIGTARFPTGSPGWGRPMTWREVERMVKEAGCAVGSHSHRHPVLSRLSSDQIRSELTTSRAAIEEHLRMPCHLFAYPYGAGGTFNARTREILEEEGFTAACTTLWGHCDSGTDPMTIPRMRTSWCDSPREIQKSLAGSYGWYSFFQRFRL